MQQIIQLITQFIFSIEGVSIFLSKISPRSPPEFFWLSEAEGGVSDSPNMSVFMKNTQALRVINNVCGHIR